MLHLSGDHHDGDVMTNWVHDDTILQIHVRDITCFYNRPEEGALEFLIILIVLDANS